MGTGKCLHFPNKCALIHIFFRFLSTVKSIRNCRSALIKSWFLSDKITIQVTQRQRLCSEFSCTYMYYNLWQTKLEAAEGLEGFLSVHSVGQTSDDNLIPLPCVWSSCKCTRLNCKLLAWFVNLEYHVTPWGRWYFKLDNDHSQSSEISTNKYVQLKWY